MAPLNVHQVLVFTSRVSGWPQAILGQLFLVCQAFRVLEIGPGKLDRLQPQTD